MHYGTVLQWRAVPRGNYFQIVLYLGSGDVVVNYKGVGARDALVGLSPGFLPLSPALDARAYDEWLVADFDECEAQASPLFAATRRDAGAACGSPARLAACGAGADDDDARASAAPYEWFAPGAFDLEGKTVVFAPASVADAAGGALAGYTFSVNASGGCLPFVPTSAAEVLELGDDDWDEVSIADAPFSFYGVARSSLFVGSNGYVTFGRGDERWGGDLADYKDLHSASSKADNTTTTLTLETWSYKINDTTGVVILKVLARLEVVGGTVGSNIQSRARPSSSCWSPV